MPVVYFDDVTCVTPVSMEYIVQTGTPTKQIRTLRCSVLNNQCVNIYHNIAWVSLGISLNNI